MSLSPGARRAARRIDTCDSRIMPSASSALAFKKKAIDVIEAEIRKWVAKAEAGEL